MSFFSTIMSIFQDSSGDDVAAGDLELNSDQLALFLVQRRLFGDPYQLSPVVVNDEEDFIWNVANPLSAHSFILDPDVVEYMLGMTGSTTRYDRSDVEEDFDQFDATILKISQLWGVTILEIKQLWGIYHRRYSFFL